MNAFERLEGIVALVIRRVEKLEQEARARLPLDADDFAAQQAAEECGFAVEVLRLPEKIAERRKLARFLHEQKHWSKARVARAFRVTERTAERWVAK